MVFWVAMPVLIAGFGNYLIPLMCGCDDMVFPRINRLSYQLFFLSAVVLLASLFVPGGGPAAVGGGQVQPHPHGFDHVGDRGGPGVRRRSCWAASTSSSPR